MRGFLVSCGDYFSRWGGAAAASEEGEQVGLGDVAHGFGEEVHHQHGGVGEVEVSKITMNDGNLRREFREKPAKNARKSSLPCWIVKMGTALGKRNKRGSHDNVGAQMAG